MHLPRPEAEAGPRLHFRGPPRPPVPEKARQHHPVWSTAPLETPTRRVTAAAPGDRWQGAARNGGTLVGHAVRRVALDFAPGGHEPTRTPRGWATHRRAPGGCFAAGTDVNPTRAHHRRATTSARGSAPPHGPKCAQRSPSLRPTSGRSGPSARVPSPAHRRRNGLWAALSEGGARAWLRVFALRSAPLLVIVSIRLVPAHVFRAELAPKHNTRADHGRRPKNTCATRERHARTRERRPRNERVTPELRATTAAPHAGRTAQVHVSGPPDRNEASNRARACTHADWRKEAATRASAVPRKLAQCAAGARSRTATRAVRWRRVAHPTPQASAGRSGGRRGGLEPWLGGTN